MDLRKIGEFLLNEIEGEIKKEDYGRFLGYITSSQCEVWAIDFARKMKGQGLDFPDSVYFFCDDPNLIKTLKNIFNAEPIPQVK